MLYSEEMLDHLPAAEEALAAGEVEDKQLIKQMRRQTTSLIRQLGRAKESLEQEVKELDSKRSALKGENTILQSGLSHEREKLLALREVNNDIAPSARAKTPPRPPPRRNKRDNPK